MLQLHIYVNFSTWTILQCRGSDPENEALGGLYLQRTLPLYRVSHVYLRLAEALNRLEKPTMAFAVLKYGLNATTLENPNRVKQSERKGEIYTDFTEDIFADNVGTATRGRGNGIPYDNEFYIIRISIRKLQLERWKIPSCLWKTVSWMKWRRRHVLKATGSLIC